MTDRDNHSRKAVLVEALRQLLKNDSQEKITLVEAKLTAIEDTYRRLEAYAQHGYEEGLLTAIAEKKTSLILQAKSISAVRELAKPPKPHYNGKSFVTTENNVPEEELICWSLASLRGPLNEAATERFLELAAQFYGEEKFRKIL